MAKYFIATFILLALGIAVVYFTSGVPSVEKTDVSFLASATGPHFFQDPSRSLKNIVIFGFYFVPKNKLIHLNGDWKAQAESNLEKLKNFHALQFRGKSQVRYELYPDPVIGREENLFYDTEITQGGNPRALISVAEELEKRIFKPDGDLHNPNFKRQAGEYPVSAIFYEGVGAAGGAIQDSQLNFPVEIAESLGIPESAIFILDVESVNGLLLVNREYLSGERGPNGDSIFAHEFYHTLGAPDGYAHESGIAGTSDLMGLGRMRPLAHTYLDKETLKSFGL